MADYKTSPTRVVYLDLVIYQGHCWNINNRVDHTCYTKQLCRFLYIPANSFAPWHTPIAVIKTELIRYARTCTNEIDYIQLHKQLYQHMIDRKFKHNDILPVFDSLHNLYSQRNDLLKTKQSLPRPYRPTLVTTYDPITINMQLTTLLKDHTELLRQLNQSQFIQTLTNQSPQVVYKRTQSLQTLLIRSQHI